MDEFERIGKLMEPLRQVLDDPAITEIMVPLRAVTVRSVAQDAIERAQEAAGAIHRAMKRR